MFSPEAGAVGGSFQRGWRNCCVPLAALASAAALFSASLAALLRVGRRNPQGKPLERWTSFLSGVTLWWFNSIVAMGNRRQLQRADLCALPHGASAHDTCAAFERHWGALQAKAAEVSEQEEVLGPGKEVDLLLGGSAARGPSLVQTLWFTFRPALIQMTLLRLTSIVLAFLSPHLLRCFIAFWDRQAELDWAGSTYGLALLCAGVSQALVRQADQRLAQLTAARVRTTLAWALVKKGSVESNMVLMSRDSQQVADLIQSLPLLWSSPLQVALSVVFLWRELGCAVLLGLALLLLLIPLNSVVDRRVQLLQRSQITVREERSKLIKEMLQGIKVWRVMGWEKWFQGRVDTAHEREVEVLRILGYLTAFSMLMHNCVPFLVSLSSFGLFVLMHDGNVLTASQVFTSMCLFGLLRPPLFQIPTLCKLLTQVKLSLRRLEDFLHLEDVQSSLSHTDFRGDGAIGLAAASFRWDTTRPVTLKELTLEVHAGALVAVVGQEGAGKSSLLAAMLGEMEKVTGTLQRQGSVAYISQHAWLQSSTVQENVLFGRAMEWQRYSSVVKACGLLPDLQLLPQGDHTLTGKQGALLTAGQRQRISMARAVYSDADIYLLDDPLSAMEEQERLHLLEQVIGPSGLLKGKTRIVVTRCPQVIAMANQVLLMSEGGVSETGSAHSQLPCTQGAPQSLQKLYEEPESQAAQDDKMTQNSSVFNGDTDRSPVEMKILTQPETEHVITGRVDGRLTLRGSRLAVWRYLRACSWPWVALAVGAQLGQSLVSLGQDGLLSVCVAEAKQVQGLEEWTELRDSRLAVYAVMGLLQAMLVCGWACALTWGGVRASRSLHHQLLSSVLHLPLTILQTTPLGQVLCRFTQDMYVTEEHLQLHLRTWLTCVLDMVGTVLLITWVTPVFVLVVLPLVLLLHLIQTYYTSVSTRLHHLDSDSHSSVIDLFHETLCGAATVRAFGQQDSTLAHSRHVLNDHLVCRYNFILIHRWVELWMDLAAGVLLFLVTLFLLESRNVLDSGAAAMTLMYALNVRGSLTLYAHTSCQVKHSAAAVERVFEYASMQTEVPWTTPCKPPPEWPEQGVVEFQNYEAGHQTNPSDAKLRGVSFCTQEKEKVGVVGRPGAGHWSLSSSLLRLVEPGSGAVLIDGMDITSVDLRHLRKCVGILPQDPVLFSGSIRANLDPLLQHSDRQVWRALQVCHLKEQVSSLPGQLLHPLQEGGANLSAGQRRLLSLARVVLRNPRVLVVEEAIPAVSMETERQVQQVVSAEFGGSTVLTVAQCPCAVLHSHRVLVLDAGRLVEFDTPSNLLQQRGLFSQLAWESGLISRQQGQATCRVRD